MSDVTPCVVRADAHCSSYLPGHQTHWIHAKHIGRTPWGWRDAIVSGLDGWWLTVAYLGSSRQVRLWHHADLAGELQAGAPVRVHEQYGVLGGAFGWLNVVIEGGLGPVPDPADPAAWEHRMTSGVQDLGTGRALALDWLDPDGR